MEGEFFENQGVGFGEEKRFSGKDHKLHTFARLLCFAELLALFLYAGVYPASLGSVRISVFLAG